MAADVTLRFQAEVGNTKQVITALEKKVEKLGNKLDAMGRKGRKGAKGLRIDLKKVVPALIGIAGGYSLIQQAITAVLSKNREFSRDVDRISNKFGELELKLQIQAGLTPVQLQKKLPQILKNVLQTPSTDIAGALSIETQLASSGFKKVDIESGKALQTILQLKAATNQFGRALEDPKEAVKSISQFVKGSQGIANPSAADIRKTGGGLTQLFEGSDIQFKDLTDLAANAAQLKSLGLSPEAQLAAFSVIRDVKEAPEASTGLRQVTSRLRSASQSGKKTKALEGIGLSPEDIDLIGEDFPTALERLKNALGRVGEKQASDVTQTLFGEKGAAAATIVLDKIGLIREREKLLKGDAFERNVKLFQGSTFARRQRFGVREESAKRLTALKEDDITFEVLRATGKARQAELVLAAKSPKQRFAINTAATLAEFNIGRKESLGLSPQSTEQMEILRRSGRTFNEASQLANQRAIRLAERQVELLEEQNELLKQNGNGNGNRKVIRRNAHRE